MTQVSFPELFGTVFKINPVAFSIFGLSVHWYGLIICTGIILSVMNTIRCAHKEGISTDDVLDYALWTVPLAIIGARLYYVITSPTEYHSFMDVIAIWNGGIAIYGAVIAGAITVFVVSKFKKISFLKIGDAVSSSLLIGQSIGRWGNFCNGEAFGHLDKVEFLGKVIETPSFKDDFLLRMTVKSQATNGRLLTVHPTFLYESVWNLTGFIIINLLYKKKKFDGQIMLYYLIWYGLGRFFIEGLRADSLMLGNTNIRISQLLALLTFLFAVICLVFVLTKMSVAPKKQAEYVSQFGNITENMSEQISVNDNVEEVGSKKEKSEHEKNEDSKEQIKSPEEKYNGNNN